MMLLEFIFVRSASPSKPIVALMDVIPDERFPGIEVVVQEAFNGLGQEFVAELGGHAGHGPARVA